MMPSRLLYFVMLDYESFVVHATDVYRTLAGATCSDTNE